MLKDRVTTFTNKACNEFVTSPLYWQTIIRIPPLRQLTALIKRYEKFVICGFITQPNP